MKRILFSTSLILITCVGLSVFSKINATAAENSSSQFQIDFITAIFGDEKSILKPRSNASNFYEDKLLKVRPELVSDFNAQYPWINKFYSYQQKMGEMSKWNENITVSTNFPNDLKPLRPGKTDSFFYFKPQQESGLEYHEGVVKEEVETFAKKVKASFPYNISYVDFKREDALNPANVRIILVKDNSWWESLYKVGGIARGINAGPPDPRYFDSYESYLKERGFFTRLT